MAMNDETAEAPDEEVSPPRKPPRHLQFKVELRLREVIARKQLTERVDYKAIARRHRCSWQSIKQLYYEWKRGDIILPENEGTPEERLTDSRNQFERTMMLIREYHRIVVDSIEIAVAKAKKSTQHGRSTYRRLGLPDMMRDLTAVTNLRTLHEKGYDAMLEEERFRRRALDKSLKGEVVPTEAQTTIVTASDEERMLKLLDGTTHDVPREQS